MLKPCTTAAVLLAALSVLSVGGRVCAQDAIQGAPVKGAKSLDVSGSLQAVDKSRETSGSLSASLGYLVTDRTEVGVRGFASVGHSGSGTVGDGIAGVFARYNLRDLGVGAVPYVRGEVGAGFGPAFKGVTAYSGALGSRFFVKPQQAFFAELEDQGANKTIFGTRKNQLNVNFGLTFFLQ